MLLIRNLPALVTGATATAVPARLSSLTLMARLTEARRPCPRTTGGSASAGDLAVNGARAGTSMVNQRRRRLPGVTFSAVAEMFPGQ